MINTKALRKRRIHTGIRVLINICLLYTSSFRSNQSTYTIREELEMLDSVIFLMSIRYSDGFQFEKEVDEKCLDYQIPRLIRCV